MLPLLTYPLALTGLIGIPILVGIYLLRNRFRRQPVSSLMLWLDAREARQGGTRVRRLQTPLLFLLELLSLLLIVLAATNPHLRLRQSTRALVVVLDDSYSMLAGGKKSPRQQAFEALKHLIQDRPPSSLRFVLAGEKPVSLGEPLTTFGEIDSVLTSNWSCRCAATHLDEAIALASDLGGELGLLLVLTDHSPAEGMIPDQGRLQWWSYGKPRPNFAFVSASRAPLEGGDRCLLEIANLSSQPGTTTLTIEAGQNTLERKSIELDPGQTRRVIFSLKPETQAIHATLTPDDLLIDNDVLLLPGDSSPIRVDNRVTTKELREPLQRALRSLRNVTLTDSLPNLVFGDDKNPIMAEGADTWVVRFQAENDALSYSGPYVLDRTHPLTEGLSLRGVIWGAGKTEAMEGNPVIMAGNVVLLADQVSHAEGIFARHDLTLRLRTDLSTLQESPDWPILIWNMINWRSSQKPGPNHVNLRLGETVTIGFPAILQKPAQVTMPDKDVRSLTPHGRMIALKTEQVGMYQIQGDESRYSFAVNALNRDESDLLGCMVGQWGNWLDDTTLHLEYRSIAWVVLLLLLAFLTLHLFLATRSSQQGR